MNVSNVITMFVVAFCFTGLKAFQQISVATGRTLLVVPTSLTMATFEVVVVIQISSTGSMWAALPIGLGSGLGCLLAMETHRRWK